MKKKTLGQMIAELRKEKGMTQLELANQLGITDKAVSKWERDLSCPDISSLPALAEILGVTVDELMQTKTEAASKTKSINEIADIVLKAVALAMGIAVAALSALDQLNSENGMVMLGIGLACIAVTMLKKEEK
ncbi:MAG: helix-turn-helix transcriptional regulator [Lachnospiraceae bacterium]|nr:helix-turn-helix transcriptional regulator [Lachnospiraceae bacterium]